MPTATLTGTAAPAPELVDVLACTVRMWGAIRAHHPGGVPDAVLRLQDRVPRCGLVAGVWSDRSALYLAPGVLTARADEVLAALLHAAAHGLAYRCAETSATYRPGRLHSLLYRDYAVRVGLTVARDVDGWSQTYVSAPTGDRYAPELDALADALTAYRFSVLP